MIMNKELPKDAIIIDGEIYELKEMDLKKDGCTDCDLYERCQYTECLCANVFGFVKAERKNFKKLKR